MWWLSKSRKACLDFGPYESYERKFPFQVPTTQQFNFRASRVALPPKNATLGFGNGKPLSSFVSLRGRCSGIALSLDLKATDDL